MHCGLSRVKDVGRIQKTLEKYTIQVKYCDERFLSYKEDIQHFMPSVCTQGRTQGGGGGAAGAVDPPEKINLAIFITESEIALMTVRYTLYS